MKGREKRENLDCSPRGEDFMMMEQRPREKQAELELGKNKKKGRPDPWTLLNFPS